MEFHDILHGQIKFDTTDRLTGLLHDLINSPEINRLRNMRQMNFDVPLIQELGRSRRLPHSIGVAHIASKLASKSGLGDEDRGTLLAAAILHDAAIPPYGHLVESEFKNLSTEFKHEKRVAELIRGTINVNNMYLEIVPGKALQLTEILNRHHVDADRVIETICPLQGKRSPISADIDLDNIDNVHRMAAMLGWPGARANARSILDGTSLRRLGPLHFRKDTVHFLEQWLDYRQRIYTLIIAHPECIPYNALQVDLVRIAVSEGIISPNDWWLSEPQFEEVLRNHQETKRLAFQLISGCEYQTVDYVWLKSFQTDKKLTNAQIVTHLTDALDTPSEHSYFVWNEKGLVERKVRVDVEHGHSVEIGSNSTSCMIALVKKTPGKPKWTKASSAAWRRDAIQTFVKLSGVHNFEVDVPESYTGQFLTSKNNEIRIDYY